MYHQQQKGNTTPGENSKDEKTMSVWGNPERVTLMQSIWAKNPTKANRPSHGSVGSSSRSSSQDEGRATPPGYLSNEQKKKGRLLLNQIFNEMETLETDRIFYEATVGISALIPFRELSRSLDFNSHGMAKMLSETQRQFDLHVCFMNAMHDELMKAKANAPVNKYKELWNKIAEDHAKAQAELTGTSPQPIPKSMEDLHKEELEKGVQAYLGKVTGEWEKVLQSIQKMGTGGDNNTGQVFKNLELMPFYMERLVQIVSSARVGIWLLYCEVQYIQGKTPDVPKVPGEVGKPPPKPPMKTQRQQQQPQRRYRK